MIPTATKILELITDLSLEENPIVFHVFSNGGCMLYRNIIDVLHSEPRFCDLLVIGTIFDSAPAPNDWATGVRAFMASLNVNRFIRYALGFLLVLYLFGVWLFTKTISLFGYTRSLPYADFWTAMESDPSRWPQMFLYSKEDKLVPYKNIQQLAEHRQYLGVEVLQQLWDDSAHVMHFVTHRESYIKQCWDFIELCMNRL